MQFEQLGPYRIERIVGRGGMGAVYAAVHTETSEPCAIKVLSGAIADDEHFRDRFKSEVETLQTLRHPNIVQLLGYGEQDGRLFYAMELIDGDCLQALLQKRRFTWREVVDFSVQTCHALKHAHDHGVIHRDLKPANLLLTPDGQIKLTDFGIAKLFGSTQITAAGGVIGTADYMSPEQAEGLPITHRTDLYSLGCVMYALLTSKPPFGGRTVPEIMHCLKFSEPELVGRLALGTPLELEEIISQLLAKDPLQRISNATLVAKRLKSMEFGLLKQQEGDDYVLSEDDPVPREAAPITEMPTASRPTIDLPTSEQLGSGELTQAADAPEEVDGDETVLTAGEDREPNGATETQRPRAPETHFVTVDRPSQSSRGRQASERPAHSGPNAALSTIGILVALLAVLAGIWVASRPPTADSLFSQIVLVADTGDAAELVEVREQMREFLDRFPQDERHTKVAGWESDYVAHRLWRRLEREARKAGGVEFLSEIQTAYVRASRRRKLDPGKSRSLYRSIAEIELDEQDRADDLACRESASHWEVRLAPDVDVKS